jgi:cathepsin B
MQELLKSGISSESFLDAEEFNVKVKSLPAEFDWRKYRPDCITPIKDQMYCGSCYSFSVTSVLESRFCIQSNGRLKPELSQQDIVSCDTNSMKCSGAYLDTTWRFLEYYGTCSLQCKPYESGYGSVPACYGGCTNPALSYYKWRAIYGSFKFLAEPVYANRINQIKMEIYQYGPVSAVMETYEDMATFKGGVYIHTAGKKTDYHAITIVGWGYDSYYRSEYWIMRNSWGTKWGDAGYAKILFNYYQIESQMNASQPLI